MKQKYVVRIRPNGEFTTEPVGEDLLSDPQRLVGGYIETMNRCDMLPGKATMIANDEARIRDYPYNPVASLVSGYKIFGDAVIVRKTPDDIAGFTNKIYLERYLVEPLKYRLAQMRGEEQC